MILLIIMILQYLQQLGEVKIGSMLESKDFRKSIVQLEW